MTKINRFIQFNDERVDTKLFLSYEQLAKALSKYYDLRLSERKLIEFHYEKSIMSISVFWRHREKEIMHAGRLSDIYLLTVGFWRDFNLSNWENFNKQISNHHLSKLAPELLLMIEEFRLIEKIQQVRPGTARAFQIRKRAYVDFHRANVITSLQKGLLADVILSELFIVLHEGIFESSQIEWPINEIDLMKKIISDAYESKSTKDSIVIVQNLISLMEIRLEGDLFHQYYSIINRVQSDLNEDFSYHQGVKNKEEGDGQVKDTIEEVFKTWHEATKDEEGAHIRNELEHGRSSKATGLESNEGREDASVVEVGYGQSTGNENISLEEENENKKQEKDGWKEAGIHFGRANIHVVYEEKKIEVNQSAENRKLLQQWRQRDAAHVKSLVKEIRKRIEQKAIEKREHLLHGRPSSNLTSLFTEERPKPFYRKSAPSRNLDAVFGLLVDGSASMLDKLEETKKAVLLFHDVLSNLKVAHEISLYSEDAFQARKDWQPNTFHTLHGFNDQSIDNGLSILSFEAQEDNRDGFAIRWMAKRLLNRIEKHKFLLVFSDGEPSAFAYDQNGVIDTAEAVIEAEKKGITVIHLFLSTEEATEEQKILFSTMYGNKTAASNNIEEFTMQTIRILKKLFTLIVNSSY